MALNKKIENIVIGLNMPKRTIKVFKNRGSDFKDVVVEHIDCPSQLVDGKRIFEVLDSAFQFIFENKTSSPVQPDVYLVLEDQFFSADIITLPLVPMHKQKDLLKHELRRSYPHLSDYEYNTAVLSKNKKRITYSVTMVLKGIVQDCVFACKKHGLNLRNVTYESNCLVNSVLALTNKAHKVPFLFLNVEETESKVVFVAGDKTVSFCTLPFGQNFLEDDSAGLLPNVAKNLVAEKEVFDVHNLGFETHFSVAHGAIEDAEGAFKTYHKKRQRERAAIERYLDNLDQYETRAQSNFDVFARHLQGVKNSLIGYDVAAPEIAVVNMPARYLGVLENQECDIKLVPLKDELAQTLLISDYLELYGAIYAIRYNKGQNFANKEKQGLFSGFKFDLSLPKRSSGARASKKPKREKK